MSLQLAPATGATEASRLIEDQQAAPGFVPGETTSESAPGENETNPNGGDKQHKGGFQRRIDKLTKKTSDLESEATYWRERALAGSAKPETKTVDTPVVDTQKPKADDFETQADYLDALTDWKLEQREAKATAKHKETEQQTQQATKVTSFKGREATFASSAPDYADVIQGAIADELPMSPALWEEAMDHEHGPALLYHLAKNPDEAERLSALTPTQVAREVARMESRFVPQDTANDMSAETASQIVTKAPKPPTPTAKSGSGNVHKDPGQYDFAEYEAWRKKQFPNLR